MAPRVVVIGGGIAGLATTHSLARDGYDVVLLESSDRLGGLGTFFRSEDAWIERFYHCIMPTDDDLLGLLGEIGLRETISWRKTTMGMVVEGRRYPFNTPWDLLRFQPLPFSQRVRLGVMSVLLRRLGTREDLDNTRTEDWLRGLFGDRIWEGVWQPLFRSKFGEAVGDVPALYLWERLGRERNVAVRGYPHGGYHALVEGLRASILGFGARIRTSTPVAALRQLGRCVEVELAGGEVLEADWVVSTVAFPLLRRMVADDPVLSARVPHTDIPYQGVVNALFFLARPLDDRYWSPVLASGTEFDGVVEMSSLVGTERYGGRHLAYTMRYTPRTSSLFLEDETSIASRWTEELLDLYGDLPLRREDILDVHVFKAPFVEPTYPLGYGTAKPPIAVDGSPLLLVTAAQVYPRVTSWNSSVGLARRGVAELRRRSGKPAARG